MKDLSSAALAATLALALSSTVLFAAAPHVHGAGTLQLVLEGGSLNAELHLPAMDVVGFEHAPRDAKDKDAVAKAVALLADSRKVLEPPAAAQCTAAPGEVESALLEDGHDDHGKDKHAHDQHEHEHEHEHEHGHDHPDGEVHADFDVAYRFDCRHPEAIKQIKINLFQQLSHLERLEVESVTPGGQRRQRLAPGQDTITLP